MNIQEIYILNRALDGEDIFSLPPFSSLGISDLLADAVKDGMVERGLLKDHSTFTEKGLRVTDRLNRFKEAKKHVQIGNISLGILNGQESVLLLWNPLFQEYAVRLTDTADAAVQLAKTYAFLSCGEETVPDGETVKMAYSAFSEKFTLHAENHFHLVTQSKEESSDEIYFSDGEKLYVYDCNQAELSPQGRGDMLKRIAERVAA